MDTAVAGGITFAHPYPVRSDIGQWAEEFGRCIEERLDVYVETYGGGKLGYSDELTIAIKTGQIEIAMLPVARLARSWPALEILSAPGLVTTPEQVSRLLEDRDLMKDMDSMGAEASGFHVVGLGWRYGTLIGSEEILDDIGGIKVSVYGGSWGQVLERLGARGMRIAPYDIPAALQHGAVDGALTSVGFAEEISNQVRIEAIAWSDDFTPVMSPIAIVLSADAAKSWGYELLSGIRAECNEVSIQFNKRAAEEATNTIDRVEKAGIRVHSFTSITRSEWQKAMDSALVETSERIGGEADWLSVRIREAIQ